MKICSRFVLAAGLLLPAFSVLAQTTYNIDSAHSSAQFSVRHLMISNVRGEFKKLTGTIVWDANNLAASKINAVIDAATISTREEKRDAHLKTADFFDVAKYPTINFVSKQIWKDNSGKVKVKGDLIMHGVTREVVLDVDGPSSEVNDGRGNTRVGASATTKINRRDWGLSYNATLETGGLVVGDEVAISLDIEAVKQKPPATKS
jgi:polyisoprenoid-binding protein YceI